jgi:hypothetical protein
MTIEIEVGVKELDDEKKQSQSDENWWRKVE